jgi:hypothetical protein
VDPSRFVAVVDHPFFPLPPGARWVYEGGGEAEGEVDTVVVTSQTKMILGVVCTVVHDEVARNGDPVEITDDYYAQDVDGNVWYFGEATAEYANGAVTGTAGSWEAGRDGAQPGIIMPAAPVVGATYRQEFYAGEAEDVAMAVRTDGAADVPAGQFTGALVTEDWTPLEPDIVEHKTYARDVGIVMEELVRGGDETFVLVSFDMP